MRRFCPGPTLKIDQLIGIFSFLYSFSFLIKAGIMPLWYGLLTQKDFFPEKASLNPKSVNLHRFI